MILRTRRILVSEDLNLACELTYNLLSCANNLETEQNQTLTWAYLLVSMLVSKRHLESPWRWGSRDDFWHRHAQHPWRRHKILKSLKIASNPEDGLRRIGWTGTMMDRKILEGPTFLACLNIFHWDHKRDAENTRENKVKLWLLQFDGFFTRLFWSINQCWQSFILT